MKISMFDGRIASLLAASLLSAGLAGAAPAQEAADSGHKAVEVIRSGIPHDALYALEMVGEWGLTVGNFGLMLETTDGGGSWKLLEPETKLALLGVARAGEHTLVVGQQGFAMSREGEGDWSIIDTGFDARLLNVDMNDSGLAFAVGEFGFIGRSRDYGQTWEQITVDWSQYNDEGYEPHLYDAIVEDDGTIYVAGEFGIILRSRDGGDSFTEVHLGEESVFDLFLPQGASTGFAVGQEGLVLKTTDGGDSWQGIKVDTNANLLGVWAGNDEVVITGIRELLRSSDDGVSFTKTDDIQIIRTWFQGVDAGISETPTGEKGFVRKQDVYVVGHDGTIARVLE